jgi:uncharacterized protein (DUF2147 family)
MSLSLRRNRLWVLSLFFLCVWPASGKSSTENTADQILGRWLFPGRGSTVELYRVGDRYFGRISEVSPTGKQQFGITKNQLLISNLIFDGSGWSGGELIHPKTGSHFNIEVKMVDSQTLTATVYKGWRWLHKEYIMTRKPL